MIIALLITTLTTNAKSTCNANFTFSVAGLTVSFTDASTSSNAITSWQWDFGDGSTSSAQSPSHTYAVADTYYVCLTIHDNHGCSSTFCHHVVLSSMHPCHASFTFGVDSTGTIVHFSNTSTGTTGSTTYYWDFGDGNSSTLENPVHTYQHPGHHVVCLYISDATTGCSSHFCHIVYHWQTHRHHHAVHSSARGISGAGSENEQGNFMVYPNPISTSATVEYMLEQEAQLSIEIYDLLGSKTGEFVQVNETEGLHARVVDVSNLSNGIYIIKLTVDEQSFIKKITISNN